MCRWAAYIGQPLFLSQMISSPEHSLIVQSRTAEECKTAINADGFGVAWYDQRPEPGLYRDVHPAWSDPNLSSLAHQIRSRLFMAHVRASTGTATSRNNSHPFVHGRWSFMHNGQIGGFEQFRREADMLIDADLYAGRKGATDSEVLFLLACAAGLGIDPQAALEEAAARLIALSQAQGRMPHARIAAAMSDGNTLYAVRYASDTRAPSLYYKWFADWQGWAVVSEPFDAGTGDISAWTQVPAGSFCAFTMTDVTITPFEPSLRDMPAEARRTA